MFSINIFERTLISSGRLSLVSFSYNYQNFACTFLTIINDCSSKTKTVHLTEPPWISHVLKNLIKKRQRALSQGDYANFSVLRNRVIRERKVCRSKYYECRVQHLKECSPAGWWKEIKRLGGIANSSGKRDNVLKSIHFPESIGDLTPSDLAKHINNTFLIPTDRFEPLTRTPFRDGDAPFLNEIADDGSDELPTVSELSVHTNYIKDS